MRRGRVRFVLSVAAAIAAPPILVWFFLSRADLKREALHKCREEKVLADRICRICSDRIGGEVFRLGLPKDMSEECWDDGPPPINPVTGQPVEQ